MPGDVPTAEEREARARALAALPLNGLLGIELAERAAGSARLVLRPTVSVNQPDGVIHGGVLATLADSAAVYAILPDLPTRLTITSVDFRLDFVRAARAERGEIEALAEVVKVGRSVARAEVSLQQAGALVARGTFVYLVLDREPAAR